MYSCQKSPARQVIVENTFYQLYISFVFKKVIKRQFKITTLKVKLNKEPYIKYVRGRAGGFLWGS